MEGSGIKRSVPFHQADYVLNHRRMADESTSEQTNNPPPGDQLPPNPPPVVGSAALPPAAEAVVNGKTERELQLEADLKKAQTDAAYAQDEAKRLKDAQTEAPEPGKKKKRTDGGWFRTLLHEEED